MTNNRPADIHKLRQAALHEGWFLTPEQLGGPSGGGFAYVCVKARVLESVLESVRAQAAIATRVGPTVDEFLEQAAILVRNLSKALVPDSADFGVLKVAQHSDGRMKKEIKALSECRHPNLVPIFACASGEDPEWYIMKFFPGGDLAHHCSDYTAQVVKVLKRTREVAEALDVIHAKGLIHRDIKPENIFITAEGQWVLGDFGIVFDEEGTRMTQHGPTPMSKEWRPEWVVSRHVEKFEPVVDIHSLARVAYAMIAGPGKNPPVSHLDEPDFDLTQLHPGVEHINAVQSFFLDHITHKPAQSKSKTALEFIARIDELLALYGRRHSQHQILSIILADVPSRPIKDDYARYQNLRLILPPGVTRFRGSIRLHATRPVDGILELSVRKDYMHQLARDALTLDPTLFKRLKDTALVLHGAVVAVTQSDSSSLGFWLDFEVPATKTIPPLAFFNIESAPNAHITGIQLVVDCLA